MVLSMREAPDGHFETVVEIPLHSRLKYEIDADSNELWLSRPLHTATLYPVNYGFFPRTLALDGDPLDALVLFSSALQPGCRVWSRPVGVLEVEDESGIDMKVLCVVHKDPQTAHIKDITDVQAQTLAQIKHFFETYKELEDRLQPVVGAWLSKREALAWVQDATLRFKP
jgi:inorganic pyrophosphatase